MGISSLDWKYHTSNAAGVAISPRLVMWQSLKENMDFIDPDIAVSPEVEDTIPERGLRYLQFRPNFGLQQQ